MRQVLRAVRAAIAQSLKPRPRELQFLPYAKADELLKSNTGWRLAKEEDTNQVPGWVYLERDA